MKARGTFEVMRAVWGVSRPRATGLVTCVVASSAGTPAAAFMSKRVIDSLGVGPSRVLPYATVFLVAFAASAIGARMLTALWLDVGDRVAQLFELQLLEAGASAPGLEHLERPDYADKVQAARSMTWVPVNMVGHTTQAIGTIISLGSAIALLSTVQPLIALTPALLLPGAWLLYRASRTEAYAEADVAEDRRWAYLYMTFATSATEASETRIFGLGPTWIARYNDAISRAARLVFRRRLRYSLTGVAYGLMQGAALAAGILLLLRLASRGSATVGDVVMSIGLLTNLVAQVNAGVSTLAFLGQTSVAAENYLWLRDYQSPVRNADDPKHVTTPVDGVRFEDVSFTYPGTNALVLDGVTLHVPAGTTLAIVGENGAGKSTLVKLLCRFYDPTSGRVLVDDTDLRELDLDAWRRRSTGVFQDFAMYEVVVRESIGMGDLPRIEDREAVRAAAHASGASELVASLPRGLETQIGREWPGGEEFSVGQHQRIALGRGSMRDRLVLMALDEPTASLDAAAESHVFARFVEMARPESGPRPTTILVSHRFSTVRAADRIVVMHKGRIEDSGTHDELMARGGRYADLFTLQASRYD